MHRGDVEARAVPEATACDLAGTVSGIHHLCIQPNADRMPVRALTSRRAGGCNRVCGAACCSTSCAWRMAYWLELMQCHVQLPQFDRVASCIL